MNEATVAFKKYFKHFCELLFQEKCGAHPWNRRKWVLVLGGLLSFQGWINLSSASFLAKALECGGKIQILYMSQPNPKDKRMVKTVWQILKWAYITGISWTQSKKRYWASLPFVIEIMESNFCPIYWKFVVGLRVVYNVVLSGYNIV